MVTAEHKQWYQENGYVVGGGLFKEEETTQYRDHFMTLRRHGSYPAIWRASIPAVPIHSNATPA